MSRSGERLVVAIALLAAPLILLLVSRGGEYSALAAFSPLFFPNGVLWCWVAVAALVLAGEVSHWRSTGRTDAVPASPSASADAAVPGAWPRLAAVTLAMAGFVFTVTGIGFLIASIGFVVVTLLVLGIRSPRLVAGFGITLPLGVFVLFHHGLGLPLPTSPFSHLF